MKRFTFILLLLASFALAVEPATAVAPVATKDTAKVVAPAPKPAPATAAKKDTAKVVAPATAAKKDTAKLATPAPKAAPATAVKKDTAKVVTPAPKAAPATAVKKDTAKVVTPATAVKKDTAKVVTPATAVKKDTAKVVTPATAVKKDTVKAVTPATAVKKDTVKAETHATAVKKDTVKAETPATAAKKDTAKAETHATAVKKDTAKVEVPEAVKDTAKVAEVAHVADSTAVDSTVAEMTPVADSSAVDSTVAEIIPVADSSAVDSTIAEAPAPKKIRVRKPKAKPLLSSGGFEFDFKSDFEIQAGKVFWASEEDPNGDNMEEWFGRASLSLFTKTENFNGKIKLSMYPGNLMESSTVVETPDGVSTTEMRDVLELKEAWACQRTKYINFKLGRWENTDKNGDYFGGYIDGYLNGFKSYFDSENMIQFGFTPTENLSVEVAFISTGPHLNTGDLRAVARFSKLSGIEALDIDLSARTNLFDKVYSHKSDVRTTVSLKATAPIIAEKLFVFGEVAMLELGADSTEKYIDGNSIPRERKIPVDLKMPLTGGLLFQPGVIDRMILEVEYISDRYKTKYHSSSSRVKDLLTAFYIEKDLTDRFTLSAGFHSYGSSKDFMLSGNLIGRIN